MYKDMVFENARRIPKHIFYPIAFLICISWRIACNNEHATHPAIDNKGHVKRGKDTNALGPAPSNKRDELRAALI